MRVIDVFSNNFDKILGKKRRIKFIILHYTGMQSTIESISRLKSEKFKVSCHYLISKNGYVYRLVSEKNVAWHAGKSRWKEFVNLNWKIIYKNMKRPAFLFDGRNILSKDKLKKIGFEIYQIGK